MTLHYQEIEGGGLRAAYLVEPRGDFEALDALVRGALDMHDVEPTDPTDVLSMPTIPPAYIIDGPKERVYHTTRALVRTTGYTVYVRKDGQRVVVGIQTKLPFGTEELQVWVESVVCRDLSSKGLTPMDSRRESIPTELLRSH